MRVPKDGRVKCPINELPREKQTIGKSGICLMENTIWKCHRIIILYNVTEHKSFWFLIMIVFCNKDINIRGALCEISFAAKTLTSPTLN